MSLFKSETRLLLFFSEKSLCQKVVRGCDVVISVSIQCSNTHTKYIFVNLLEKLRRYPRPQKRDSLLNGLTIRNFATGHGLEYELMFLG